MHYNRLFHICNGIIRDSFLAEDVVQESFIKAIQKVDSIEDKSKVGAWLSVIATRTAIDYVRRERNKKWVPMEQQVLECIGQEMRQNVEVEVEMGMSLEMINRAIPKLAHEYQDVLRLKLGHGLKEKEIANILDLNPYTVKTRIYRARKQLKLLYLEQIGA